MREREAVLRREPEGTTGVVRRAPAKVRPSEKSRRPPPPPTFDLAFCVCPLQTSERVQRFLSEGTREKEDPGVELRRKQEAPATVSWSVFDR